MMRLCWTPVLLIFCATLLAQPIPVQPQPVRPCPFDALEATFQAMDGPDNGYTLALNLHNISNETCWMETYPGALA